MMRKQLYPTSPILSLYVAACLASQGSTAPFQQGQSSHILQTRDNEAEKILNCESITASDYYGLGVRLGIYFAWATASIANNWVPSEIAGALDTNCIFLLALLTSMLRSTHTNLLKQIDALILLQLGFGTIFGVLSLWGYRTCFYQLEGPSAIRHFGGFGTTSRIVLAGATSVFAAWFWLHGVLRTGDGLHPVKGDGCDKLYVFFFAKLPALGGIRIFLAVMSVIFAANFGAILVVSSIAAFSRVRRMVQLARAKQWAETSRLKYRTGFNDKEWVWSARTF
jgi:hypothetical protein